MTQVTGLTSPWRQRALDALCLFILAGTSVVIRYDTLRIPVVNVDESQYEARAAYLLATGQSTFDVPHGPVATAGLFKAFAKQFGPYCMPQMRWLVLLISLTIACVVFAIVRGETNRWWGLLAGVVFLMSNPYVGGYQVNREWFSLLPAVVGWCLYRMSWGKQGWRSVALVYLAGVMVGMAVWFKFQAIPLTGAIVMMIAADAAIQRQWRRPLLDLALYALGGLTAAVIYLAPFALHATLGEHLQFVFGFKLPYSQGSGYELPFVTWLIMSFYLFVQPRSPAALAYPFALGCLIVAAARIAGRRLRSDSLLISRTGLFFSFVLIASLIAAQLGGRYYDHYYLYLVLPLAILFALALRNLFDLRYWSWDLAAGTLILLLLDQVSVVVAPSARGTTAGERWVILLVAVLAGLAVFNRAIRRFRKLASENELPQYLADEQTGEESPRQVPATMKIASASAALSIILGLLVLSAGNLAVRSYRILKVARADPSATDPQMTVKDAAALLNQIAKHGQRAFVWGWRPELYSLTQLEPASRFEICQYLVADEGVPEGFTNQQRRLAMRDLAERPPEFICDAHEILPGLSSVEDYELQRFPELKAYVDTNYEKVARVSNIDVYIRHDARDAIDMATLPEPWRIHGQSQKTTDSGQTAIPAGP